MRSKTERCRRGGKQTGNPQPLPYILRSVCYASAHGALCHEKPLPRILQSANFASVRDALSLRKAPVVYPAKGKHRIYLRRGRALCLGKSRPRIPRRAHTVSVRWALYLKKVPAAHPADRKHTPPMTAIEIYSQPAHRTMLRAAPCSYSSVSTVWSSRENTCKWYKIRPGNSASMRATVSLSVCIILPASAVSLSPSYWRSGPGISQLLASK